MIFNTELSVLFGGAAILMSFLALGKLRLRQLARYYGIASFFLACAIFVVGEKSGSSHMYLTAIATALIKGLIIPLLFFFVTKKAHLNERLLSSAHSTTSYFLAALAIGLAFFSAIAAGPIFGEVSVEGLFEAFAFLFLGVVMVMLRRDLVSQIIGFLIFENGVSFLTVITTDEVPFVAELGILVTVLVSAYLMSLLSLRLKGLYAVEDTDALRPYVE
jgi:hydrogenase-4 component E